jgi:hypothetical protein
MLSSVVYHWDCALSVIMAIELYCTYKKETKVLYKCPAFTIKVERKYRQETATFIRGLDTTEWNPAQADYFFSSIGAI